MADVVLVGRVNILLVEAHIFQVRVEVPEGVPQEVQVLYGIPRQQVNESSYEEFLELLYQSLEQHDGFIGGVPRPISLLTLPPDQEPGNQWYGNFTWEGVESMWFAMPHFWEPIRHHVHLVAVHPIHIGDLFQQLIALGIPQQHFAQNLPQQHVAQDLEAGDAEEEEDAIYYIEAAAEEHVEEDVDDVEEHDGEEGVDADEDDDAEEEEDDIYVVEAAAEEHVVEDVDDVEEAEDDDDDAEEHDGEDDAAVEHDGEEEHVEEEEGEEESEEEEDPDATDSSSS